MLAYAAILAVGIALVQFYASGYYKPLRGVRIRPIPLVLELNLSKTRLLPKEPVDVTVVLRNNGIFSYKFYRTMLHFHSPLDLHLVEKRTGKVNLAVSKSYALSDRPVKWPPGKSEQASLKRLLVNYNKGFVFPRPGTYEIWAEYRFYEVRNITWEGDGQFIAKAKMTGVRSNTVCVTVVEPEGEDAEAARLWFGEGEQEVYEAWLWQMGWGQPVKSLPRFEKLAEKYPRSLYASYVEQMLSEMKREGAK